MVGAEVVFVPGLGVAAIAAAADVSLELHPMPLMITLLKTILTNNTSRILLTIQAAPRDVSRRQLLGTDRRLAVLIDKRQNLGIIRLLTRPINLYQAILEECLHAFHNLISRCAAFRSIQRLQNLFHGY